MGVMLPPGPETAPIKDALRGLRHALRRGRETLEGSVPASLPAPASAVARSLLKDIGHIARGIDHVAYGVAVSVFGTTSAEAVRMDDLTASEDSRIRFSGACYEALKHVLRRLGEARPLVSEAAVQRAAARLAGELITGGPAGGLASGVPEDSAGGHEPDAGAMETAATFTLALIAEHPIRNASLPASATLPREALEPVAVFAAVLSLLAEEDASGRGDIVASAADLSMALSDEIAAACKAGDRAELAALYRKYAAHV